MMMHKIKTTNNSNMGATLGRYMVVAEPGLIDGDVPGNFYTLLLLLFVQKNIPARIIHELVDQPSEKGKPTTPINHQSINRQHCLLHTRMVSLASVPSFGFSQN
jgi:hypothetical protein